jgi:hypothetical protein
VGEGGRRSWKYTINYQNKIINLIKLAVCGPGEKWKSKIDTTVWIQFSSSLVEEKFSLVNVPSRYTRNFHSLIYGKLSIAGLTMKHIYKTSKFDEWLIITFSRGW